MHTQAVGQTTPDPSVRPVISVQPSTSRFDNNLAVAEQKQQDLRQAVKQSMAETNQPYTPSPAMQGVIERMNAGIERRIKGDPIADTPVSPTRRMTIAETYGAPKGTRAFFSDLDMSQTEIAAGNSTPGRIWVHPNREPELKQWLQKQVPQLQDDTDLEFLSTGSYFWQEPPGSRHPADFTKMTGEPIKAKPGEFWLSVSQKDKALRKLLSEIGYYEG
jgi:hypothetical protein